MANLDWLVVRDFSLIETRDLVEGRPGDRDRRAAHGGHRDRGVLPAGRRAHREGRQLHQHAADAAVAPHRRSSRRGDARSELWFMYHLGRRIREKLAGSTDRDGPAGPRPDVGLPDRGAAAPSRAPRPCCAEINGWDADGRALSSLHRAQATTARRRAAAGSTAASTPTGSTRPRAASPGSEQNWVAPRVGLGVARQPADPLQPRLRRSRTAGRGASARRWSGGTRASGSGPATTCPTSRRTRRPTTGRPTARTARTRCPVTDPFIMQADGKAWLFAPAGLVDGPLPDALRAAGVPVRQPALRAAAQPGPPGGRRRSTQTTGCSPAAASPARTSSPSSSPPTGSPSTTPRAA